MQGYALSWIWIKSQPKLHEGASNFWYMALLLNDMNQDDKEIIEKLLKNNSYFAQSGEYFTDYIE